MAMSDFYRRIRESVGSGLLMMPAVAAAIRDQQGRVLLQLRPEGDWSLPAGAIEPGETPAEAIIREVAEETGLQVRPTCLVAVCGGRGYRVTYANGDEVEYLIVVFECDVIGGALEPDGVESVELRYTSLDDFPELPTTYPRELLEGRWSPGAWFEGVG